MDEQIKKSKQIEAKIISDIHSDRTVSEEEKQDIFSSYTQDEQQKEIYAMTRTAEQVHYESTLSQEKKDTFNPPSRQFEEARILREHQNVQDEYAGMSWSQKRKLQKQREKDLDAARSGGVAEATELTLPLAQARAEAAFAWDERMDRMTQQERSQLSGRQPDANLFDKHYKKGSVLPYDINAMTARLKELELVGADLAAYKLRLAGDPAAEDWQFETNAGAQETLCKSLGKAIEAMYLANAVPVREVKYLTQEELAMDKAALLEQCIADYQQKAENFDVLMYDSRISVSAEKLSRKKESTPKNEDDEAAFGFTFMQQRPAQLDELRAQMDAQENSQRVLENKEPIAVMWREYIRVCRTIDEEKAEAELQKQHGGEAFEEQRFKKESSVFKLEGMREAYAEILRHYICGSELDSFTDALIGNLATKLGRTYTEHRLEIEKQYGGTYTTENSAEIRKLQIERSVRNVNSAGRYFCALPKEQVNELMDTRIIYALCSGWNTGLDGEPLTEEDRQIMERETKFIRDLFGKDDEARHAVIDEEIAAFISTDIPVDLLEPGFVLKDPIKASQFTQRYLLLDNFITGDPEYFETLAPEIKAKINFVSKFSAQLGTYLSYNQMVSTGVTELYTYMDEGNKMAAEAMVESLKPVLKEQLSLYPEKMRMAVFDATTDTFTVEEQARPDYAFGVMKDERFLQKLKKRRDKGLPCSDLGEVFDVMQGRTLGEYFDSIANPTFDEETAEAMRDSGFAGRTFHMDGVDFGTDDMAFCAKTIMRISRGGQDAAEFGVDEETAQAVKVMYEAFRQESYENQRLKSIDDGLAPFDAHFGMGLRLLKGHEAEFPELCAQLAQYHELALNKMDEVEARILESDKQLKEHLFMDIIAVMDKKGVSFRADHRELLNSYMADRTQDPVPEHSVSCTLNGAPLTLYGDEGELPEISDELIERKHTQLGEGFGGWAAELTENVQQANEAFIRGKKYESIAGAYYEASNTAYTNESLYFKLKEQRDKADPGSQEYADLTGQMEEKQRIKAEEEAKIPDIPVFGQVKHKAAILQYELNQKQLVCGNQYEKALEKIRGLIQ